jgi:NAD(P)-dependent dehydrogenase (short-subunit alcohol dehydrogenase family)
LNTVLFDDIKNKVCIVTGGCGILGSVFVKGLLEKGAKVAVADYRLGDHKPGIDETGNLFYVQANVLDKESLKKAKELINAQFGKIDLLINGAGGNAPTATTKNEFLTSADKDELAKSFFGLELDGFRSVFDLNFLGTVLPTMVFAEDMIERGGSIINVSSMNSFRPLTKIPAYSAAKASINNLTQWLAVHFAKVNIRVNAIAPGFFLTNQNRFLLVDEKTNGLTPRGESIIAGTPMGKFGEPEDLLGTIFFIASEASKFITGIVIPIDGGFSAYSGV